MELVREDGSFVMFLAPISDFSEQMFKVASTASGICTDP